MEKLNLFAVFIGLLLCGGSILFGKFQFKKWRIENRIVFGIYVLSNLTAFLVGGYLMSLYGYHLLKMMRYWILMAGLFLISCKDYCDYVIPNRALLILCGIRVILIVFECIVFPGFLMEIFSSAMIGLVGGTAIFALAGLIARKGIGMGDVKLIGMTGFYLGFQVLMSDLIITMTITVVVGIVMIMKNKKSLRSEMPFAPMAAAGTLITILMGF